MLVLIAEGLSNADIGSRVHLSAGTVKDHVSAILTKLRVNSRVGRAARPAGGPAGREPVGAGDERGQAVVGADPDPVVDAVVVAVAAVDVLINLGDSSRLATAATAVACAALALRRRFPLTVFLLTLPASLMVDIVFASLAALFTLAERSRDRRLLVASAFLFAGTSAVPWPLGNVGWRGTRLDADLLLLHPGHGRRPGAARPTRPGPAGLGRPAHGDRSGPRTRAAARSRPSWPGNVPNWPARWRASSPTR